MILKPLADCVVLKQFEAEEKTKGGIILSSATKEKPQIFDVIEVGPGGMIDGAEVVMTVKKGDKVIVANNVGTETKIDDQDYLFVKQSDILAIVE